MIEIIDGTWAAGETKTFHINGEYLEILDAQYPCDVFLMDKVGSQLSAMKGCEASFFSRPREGFQTVQIRSVQAQYLRVFIGSGDAGTRRISSTVQVIDGARARTLAGVAFGVSSLLSAVAGQWQQAAIRNPPGSGRRIVVNSILLGNDVQSPLNLVRGAGAPQGLLISGGITTKDIGGAGSFVAQKYDYTGATASTAAVIASMSVPAGASFLVPMTEPYVIEPGFYFGACLSSAGSAIATYFQGYEEVL